MLLLPALAHAALRDDLRTALANGPTAAVVCSSGTEAMQRVASSLELLGDEVGDTTPFTTLFNVNTAVGLTYWEANKTVEMRFAMADEAAARQWVSTVGERLGKDPRAYDVHWKDGWGAIQSGEIPTSNPAASTDLLTHLSDAPVYAGEARLVVLLGTREVEARVVPLDAEGLLPGETCHVQIRAGEPLPCLPGDRFVVRRASPAATVGGGRT